MKAETYLVHIIRREFKTTPAQSKRLARRVATTPLVLAIKEGPQNIVVEKRAYAR